MTQDRFRIRSIFLVLALAWVPCAPAGAAPGLVVAAKSQVDKLDTSKATQSPTAPAAGPEKRSFFSTPKGIAATILFAGVAAYTLHSRISDSVHSPGRT